MSNPQPSKTHPGQPVVYEIRLEGQLGRQWADRFGGMTITSAENGDTLLIGAVVDQAALYGLLRKVRDLGIPLYSLQRVEPGRAGASVVQGMEQDDETAKPGNLGGMLMKAVVYHEYGSPDGLKLEEVAKPTPKSDQVLIRVRAASLNAADWHLLMGEPFMLRFTSGLTKPKNTILGADVAGLVEAVGTEVTQFKPGDEVFGDLSECGWGGFAEYVCAPENALVLKPAATTFEQAAAVPMAAVTALQGLRDSGQIQPGQKVLINGASGGVGTFAVQIAKSFGAQVTAVCSTSKLDMARSIGADHVIDYTQEDFTRNGQQYDLIIGANGYYSLSDYKRALSPAGTFVCTGGTMTQIFESMLLGPLMSLNGGKKLRNMGVARPDQKDLTVMKELLQAGSVVPVIDRCYALTDVPAALRYLGAGHARGKVVINVA